MSEWCFWHGKREPIDKEVYIVCGECGHAFTEVELLEEHNKQAARAHFPPEKRVDKIFSCPLCIHDF